ncbi:hypothetical protein NDU88_000973 [Pleurodeles waltl]|uniref:Uncharacterized protein n=1 Tax=Pleurodeles waltl TaxID=8319 RepID=A0AAV7P2K6_PLEWA|nr:hypothetical protein NDU88_000973 [Pleurodeles waltl]
MLHEQRRCSEEQPVRIRVAWGDRQEVRERFSATIPTTRDQRIHETKKPKCYWKTFDGGVGDGERPGVSCGELDKFIECELDYDEEDEELEGGKYLLRKGMKKSKR